MTKPYSDIYYKSPDGLELYARDYGGEYERPTLLCMHGLTRNSADFHNLAIILKDNYRIVSVDQRGRGLSDYDSNSDNYRPDIYCSDMFVLLRYLQLENVIAIGTSMGGLMTMMMSAAKPGLFKAAIINDIGPDIDPAGLERIKGYVGGRESSQIGKKRQTQLRHKAQMFFQITPSWIGKILPAVPAMRLRMEQCNLPMIQPLASLLNQTKQRPHRQIFGLFLMLFLQFRS